MTTEEKTDEKEEKEAAAAERTALTKLAERGDEALRRLAGELEKNPRMADARERLVGVEKSVLSRLRFASLDEVEELRKDVARLEERLAKLEGGARKKASAAPDAGS